MSQPLSAGAPRGGRRWTAPPGGRYGTCRAALRNPFAGIYSPDSRNSWYDSGAHFPSPRVDLLAILDNSELRDANLMSPILVTGATGLVGNNVVRRLLARGDDVRVLVRRTSDPRPVEGLNVDCCWGDVRDAESVAAALADCRAVVHAAAMVRIGWTRLDEMRAINVAGTRHVAEAALCSGVRMVHVSSVDALGTGSREHPVDEGTAYTPRTPCPYAITKREAEMIVRDLLGRGLDAVIVNPSYMLGPWDWKPSSGRMILEVARTRPAFAPRAGNDYTHIVDVADGIVSALDRAPPGERYLLTGEHHDYMSAWRIMAQVCGVRAPKVSVGPLFLYPGGWIGDLKAKLSGREGDINSAAIRMMREPHFYSHAKATRELDYHPRGLREAASDAWQWFQEIGYAPLHGPDPKARLFRRANSGHRDIAGPPHPKTGIHTDHHRGN